MKKRLWEISWAVLPHRRVFDFNQALMDFGALACSARKPVCAPCPMASRCKAYPFTGPASRANRPRRRA
jgi:A/G-specific adenine glycosylase